MKRKNDRRSLTPESFLAILVCLLAVALFFNSVERWSMVDDCMDVMDGVDFVMVGFEGDRGTRYDAPALLDALDGLALVRVDGVPAGAVRHMDMGLYDEHELVGTLLFWNAEGMADWWVVMDDGQRRDCGVYAVELSGVMRVFDAMRSGE